MPNQFPTTGTQEGDIRAGYITGGVYNPNPTVRPNVQNPASLQGTLTTKPTQPVVVPPQVQQQSSPMALFLAMNAMQSQTKANNVLMTQRNLLLKHLYDTPLTTEEINQLDPTMKDAVLKNDRDQIDMSLRIISDEVQGRNQSIDKSFQYLMTNYQQAIKDAETQRIQSQNTVLNYAKALNAKPSDIAKALNVQGDFDMTALDALAVLDRTENTPSTDIFKKAIDTLGQYKNAGYDRAAIEKELITQNGAVSLEAKKALDDLFPVESLATSVSTFRWYNPLTWF